jgi:hypothetical protein
MHSMSDRSEETCATLLGRGNDPDARSALARYLADNLQTYPDGRAALERLLERETDVRVGAYVAGRLHRTSADAGERGS